MEKILVVEDDHTIALGAGLFAGGGGLPGGDLL